MAQFKNNRLTGDKDKNKSAVTSISKRSEAQITKTE